MLILIFLIAILGYLFYKWSISTFDYFEKQNIPFRKPIPLFGTNQNMFKQASLNENMDEWYFEFRDEKVSGLFEFRQPVIFLRDPQLIKQLLVKDFEHFADHMIFISEEMDPLFGKSLFLLTGQKWKDMRTTLSPAFTGSKMRQMFNFVNTVSIQTIEAMRKDIESGKESVVDFKDLASKFACDNIATCAFGIEVNSFQNPSNDFYTFANKVMDFSGIASMLKLTGFMAFPKLMKYFKVRFLDKQSSEYFQDAFYDTMKTREKLGIVRNDMINLLLETKKGKLTQTNNKEDSMNDAFATVEESHVGKSTVTRKWDDEDLVAQCFLFFIAGFDTVAQTMSFMAYELALNPDIQQRLYEEILETVSEADGQKINYDQMQSMKYMDQVVSETMRKWPVVGCSERVCAKDYVLEYDGKKLKIEKNQSLAIPIWSLHRDPQYYPEPERFDPERFNDKNKHKIPDSTYLPFGIGPRICIGNRFALMELKTIFVYLLLNFTIEVTEKTQIPLKFAKSPFETKPEKGIWVELRPRSC